MAIVDICFDPTETVSHELPVRGSYTLSGQVVDAGNTPVSGVVVKAFVTSSNAFINSTTTDGSGNWNISTPWYEAHFIIAYLDSTTDSFGTSVNTLMPV